MGCIWEKPIQNKWIINIQEMQKYHKNNSDIYVVGGENFMIMRWFVETIRIHGHQLKKEIGKVSY